MIYENDDELGYFAFPPRRKTGTLLTEILSASEWRSMEAAAVYASYGLAGLAERYRTQAGYGGLDKAGPYDHDKEGI